MASPHEFFAVSCLDESSSPDSRCRIEAETAKLALQLRDDPTVPADPRNPNLPLASAFRQDAAVQLPAKHCAFRGCLWTSSESWHVYGQSNMLVSHLMERHRDSLDKVAELYHTSHTVEERVVAAYNSALSMKVQKAAPLASSASILSVD